MSVYTHRVTYIRIPRRGALVGMRLNSSLKFCSAQSAQAWVKGASRDKELIEFLIIPLDAPQYEPHQTIGEALEISHKRTHAK